MKCNTFVREDFQRFQCQYIKFVKSPDGHVLRSDHEIREAFQAHFCNHFACLLDLLIQEFHNYLADLPCFQEAEAAGCKWLITECEVCDALKQVSLNKSPGLDSLPYKVYLRMLHIFVPIQMCSTIGLPREPFLVALPRMWSHCWRKVLERIEVDTEAALISLDQSNAFDRVDHWFLATVLETTEFQ